MTSRLGNLRANVTAVEIDAFAIRDAVNYLRTESKRSDLSDADAESIAEALGRLPLALSLAAAYLRETLPGAGRYALGLG